MFISPFNVIYALSPSSLITTPRQCRHSKGKILFNRDLTMGSSPVLATDATFRSCYWINQELYLQDRDKSITEFDNMVPTNNKEKSSIVTNQHLNRDGKVIAVEVSSVLSEKEANVVQTLAQSIRYHDTLGSSQFQHRSFGDEKGGNDCTYLAPLLQAFSPNLVIQIIRAVSLAWETAGWEEAGYPNPSSLGIRTSEHLSYSGWRSLEPHKDVGSIYTTMIALKNPTEYDGGDFFVQNSLFDSTDVKPERLCAIVFLSDTTHGVRPISKGQRETFVTELWDNDDAPLGMNRPTSDEWEAFLTKQ
jgi:hypothetical protein